MMTPAQKKRLKELRALRDKKEKEYYHLDAIRATNSTYNIVFGERKNGKSYALKKEALLKDAMDNRDKPEGPEKKLFAYIRRYSDDCSNASVEQWLQDMTQVAEGHEQSPIMELSEGQFNDFQASRGKIYAIYRNENGEIVDKYKIGYFVNLGHASNIKTQSFMDVYNILFEEFIEVSRPYLTKDCELFENIIDTIVRRRTDVKIWLCGNSNDRDQLYFRYWGLDGVKTQKEGTIDTYEKLKGYDEYGEPQYVRISVEYCPDIVKSSEGVHFGQGNKNNSGEWYSTPQPKMTQQEVDELDEIYEIFVIYHELKYHCSLLLNKDNSGYFWYVRPWNRPTIKPGVRIVSDKISTDPMTTAGFFPVFEAEANFFRLIEESKVYFCDDLTGVEFKRAVKYFANNKIYQEG